MSQEENIERTEAWVEEDRLIVVITYTDGSYHEATFDLPKNGIGSLWCEWDFIGAGC